MLGRHEQGSLAPVEADEKRGGGCGIGWIEGRRKVAVVGSMWNWRRILERVAADREWRMGQLYFIDDRERVMLTFRMRARGGGGCADKLKQPDKK